ncbi:MAG: hypothetical protein K2N64_03440 [Anaeroplasmataceae bacterium]|nr:hypothetical protein [Anaeroplasmataceae bacterium]
MRCNQCDYLLDLEKDFGIISGGTLSLDEKTYDKILWFNPKDIEEQEDF